MNLSMKQKQTNRLEDRLMAAKEEGWRQNGLEVWGQQIQTITYRMHEQQDCTLQYRGLYSISCNKPQWKKYEKEYVYR